MLKVEKIQTVGVEPAIRGMRNPMNSWNKSDSYHENGKYIVGKKDTKLAKRLIDAGSDHRKFLRQMILYMDITAPLFWWKQFDTYKVATVSNSCSTMHTITHEEFKLEDFSFETAKQFEIRFINNVINMLNEYRWMYLNYDKWIDVDPDIAKNVEKKDVWRVLIELLPSSYNQKRTVGFSYETALNIINNRQNHKLKEWNDFVNILKQEMNNNLEVFDGIC